MLLVGKRPTIFLPIDPRLPTCLRWDKVGMTWLLNRVLKEQQPSWRQAVESLPTLGDRGSRSAMMAKREDAYQSVKKPRRIPHWERLPFTGLGGEAGPPGGEAPARDG